MGAQEGPLVIGDISGYTAFVAGTELEHSRDILDELMDVMVRSLTPRLRLAQVEGDALFCVGERLDGELLDLCEASFISFHRRIRDIKAVTTCPCQACRLVGTLTLKFICHYGQFVLQHVAGTERLYGPAVNAVHRLAKNSVPSHEYVLATSDVLDRLPEDRRRGFTPHSESYPDAGTIEAGYRDLAELRRRAYAEERTSVTPEEARLRRASVVDAPLPEVWWLLTDPEAFRRWSHLDSVELRPGARGTLYGAEYHCHHGRQGEEVRVFRVVGLDEPHEITRVARRPFGDVYFTHRLKELDAGHTALEALYYWDPKAGALGAIRDALLKIGFRLRGRKISRAMRQILAERLAAARAPA